MAALTFIIDAILEIIAFLFFMAIIRTYVLRYGRGEGLFLSGKAPVPHPEGFYMGKVGFNPIGWWGKKFEAETESGTNVFGKAEKKKEAFPFKTSYGKGFIDKQIDVLKIDYNVPGNPFWMRPILDEIVEVEEGQYLGKLHYRLSGRLSFVLTFFRLKK